jgi:prepilin-type N-terminal cleavage/methylation domain-containing protein
MYLIQRRLRHRLQRLQGGRSSERGFTLIEMLITIVILGIIAVPLATVITDYFLDTAAVSARLSESQDQSFMSAYWQQDVSSVGVRTTAYDPVNQTYALQQSVNTAFPCTKPTGASTVVTLAWNQYDATGAPTLVTVGYFLVGGTQLVRERCDATTITSTTTLANYVSGSPLLVCIGPGVLSCTQSGPDVPTTVTLTLYIQDTVKIGQPYLVSLIGQRRQT